MEQLIVPKSISKFFSKSWWQSLNDSLLTNKLVFFKFSLIFPSEVRAYLSGAAYSKLLKLVDHAMIIYSA